MTPGEFERLALACGLSADEAAELAQHPKPKRVELAAGLNELVRTRAPRSKFAAVVVDVAGPVDSPARKKARQKAAEAAAEAPRDTLRDARMNLDQVAAPDAGPVGSSPTPEAGLEEQARVLYNTWSDQPGWVPWVVGGNSDMQYKARREVQPAMGAAETTVEDLIEAALKGKK